MSCPPLPPHSPNPTQAILNDNNDALSSDYGSDFSADEADLLNELLADVDAPGLAAIPIPATAVTGLQSQQKTQDIPTRLVRAVPDIEDCGEDVSDRRVPRVLGRERPPLAGSEGWCGFELGRACKQDELGSSLWGGRDW